MSRRFTNREDIASVISLYKASHKVSEIVEITGVCRRSVYRLIERYKESGEQNLPVPKPRSGWPKLTSPRTRKVINRQVNANPRLTARGLKQTSQQLLGNVLIRSIQQFLHDDLGYRSYRAHRQPLLTAAQTLKRFRFAKKYSVWSEDNWRRALWHDEATFTVTGNGYDRLYRKPHSDMLDPKYTCKIVKHPDSVMVCGCFGYFGVGELVVLPKNVKLTNMCI